MKTISTHISGIPRLLLALTAMAGTCWLAHAQTENPPAIFPGSISPGAICGVGLELRADTQAGSPRINGVVPGSPAAKAQIQPGSLLVSINGTNTFGRPLKECVELVRGEENTSVVLELADSAREHTNRFTLKRAPLSIATPPVRSQAP